MEEDRELFFASADQGYVQLDLIEDSLYLSVSRDDRRTSLEVHPLTMEDLAFTVLRHLGVNLVDITYQVHVTIMGTRVFDFGGDLAKASDNFAYWVRTLEAMEDRAHCLVELWETRAVGTLKGNAPSKVSTLCDRTTITPTMTREDEDEDPALDRQAEHERWLMTESADHLYQRGEK